MHGAGKGNGRGERTGDGRGDRTGRSRATGASDGVEYDVSDDVHYGACVEVLQVVRRSPSGGAFTRQVHADTPLRCAGRACASHLLLGSARAPTALRRILHGHIHTPLPACGRTRLGPATRARPPEAAADAETAIVGCGWPVWVAGVGPD